MSLWNAAPLPPSTRKRSSALGWERGSAPGPDVPSHPGQSGSGVILEVYLLASDLSTFDLPLNVLLVSLPVPFPANRSRATPAEV